MPSTNFAGRPDDGVQPTGRPLPAVPLNLPSVGAAYGVLVAVFQRAAVIMVAVFGLFATLSLIQMPQLGFGLAVAILIDATIVRAVLLPSTMRLLGEWNWYLPRWLLWLPSLAPEASGTRRICPPRPLSR